MVSLVVAPEPDHWPPRVRLDLDTEEPDQTFTAIRVRRNGVLLREQPYVGGQTAVAYDYEAPRDTALTYTAEVVVAAWETKYETSWADTSGWTVGAGAVSVSGGALRRDAGAAWVYRDDVDFLPGDRLTLLAPAPSKFASAALRTSRVTVQAGTVGDPAGGRAGQTYLGATAGFASAVSYKVTDTEILHRGSSLLVQAEHGPIAVPDTGGSTETPTGQVQIFVTEGGSAFPGFRIEGPTVTSTTVSSSVTITSAWAWLINPVAPLLSMPLEVGTPSFAMTFLRSGSGFAKRSAAARSVHHPIGRRRPVTITTGPRHAAEFDINLETPTLGLAGAMYDLLDNQSPILLLTPSAARWDFPDGWYSVGDVAPSRTVDPISYAGQTFRLPLTPSDPPAVSQGAVRTYGDLLGEASTYGELAELYDSYTDLLAGP